MRRPQEASPVRDLPCYIVPGAEPSNGIGNSGCKQAYRYLHWIHMGHNMGDISVYCLRMKRKSMRNEIERTGRILRDVVTQLSHSPSR